MRRWEVLVINGDGSIHARYMKFLFRFNAENCRSRMQFTKDTMDRISPGGDLHYEVRRIK